MADFNEDIWNEDVWADSSQELDEESVVINEDIAPSYNLSFDDEEDFTYDVEEESEEIQNLRNDPEVSKWLPSKPAQTMNLSGFAGIFKNEGARTGQPTNLKSSAIGRGQMIKGTREAMYRKLGVTNIEAAEQAFRTDPDFEMKVMDAYRQELDARIPSNVQGKQRDYMIAKGWYTGDPFYDDNKVPGKSAGNKLTAGEYARRAVMQYGGIGPEVYNTPDAESIDGISDDAILQYLESEGINADTYQPTAIPTEGDLENKSQFSNIVKNVGVGISKFKNFKDKLNNMGANAAKTVSEAIEFQTELAGAQRNAASLRSFQERNKVKKYYANDTNLNQPLIYT